MRLGDAPPSAAVGPAASGAQARSEAAGAAPRASGWGAPLGVALLVALVLAALARFVGPTFQGWYQDDDFQNLRWALEYRSAPWLALTERHALHDHVRPFTLLASWAGAALSGGEHWGPHLVEVALAVLAVVGAAVLGRDLSGRALGGALSAVFTVGLLGFERMVAWTAWVCSAGEVCCGTWGLVAAGRALSSARWLPVAAALLASAGLFKEPGGVVYPAAAVALAAGAWAGGQRDRRVLGVAALALVGAGTLAFTWHPANLGRMDAPGWLATALHALRVQPGFVVDTWPAGVGAGARMGAGVPLLLLVAVLVEDIVTAWAPGRHRVVVTTACVAGLGYLYRPALALLVPGLALLAIGARRRRPATALLVAYLANVVVLLPFPTFNGTEVSLLGGGVALAVYVAVRVGDWTHGAPRAGWARLVAPGAIAAAALLLAVRLVQPGDTGGLARAQGRRELTRSLGALAQSVGATEGTLGGLDVHLAQILPLYRLTVHGPEDAARPTTRARVEVPRALSLWVDAALVHERLVDHSLLGTPAPSGEASVTEAGDYVLGATAGTGAGLRLEAADGCGHRWSVAGSGAAEVVLAALPVRIAPACAPLTVSWTGALRGAVPVVTAIAAPVPSLWSAGDIPRRLPVTPALSHGRRGPGPSRAAPPAGPRP